MAVCETCKKTVTMKKPIPCIEESQRHRNCPVFEENGIFPVPDDAPSVNEFVDRMTEEKNRYEISHQEPGRVQRMQNPNHSPVGKSPMDGNPKTAEGRKKTPLRLVPPAPIISLAGVFKNGAEKYGPYNWRDDAVSASTYYEAALRHLYEWWEGRNKDPESGEPPTAHVIACMAIIIDAEKHGTLIDDRPIDKEESSGPQTMSSLRDPVYRK